MLAYDRSEIPLRDAFENNIFTDAVLNKLKEQANDGCLLCSFDNWEEEDWE